MNFAFNIYKWAQNFKSPQRAKEESYISANGVEEVLDQTGRVVTNPHKPQSIVDCQKKLVFANFENSIAHSFWRSQELSIFYRSKNVLKVPLLDFGCGDGAFSSCLFDSIDFGVDIDHQALDIARGYGIYNQLLTFDAMITDIPAQSIGTVFSCSVLEHTTNLPECIKEISRVLRRGGTFHFTVPNINFSEQMKSLIDINFSSKMNGRMFHRNLLNKSQWIDLLLENGFQIEKIQSFQPISFTKKYFSLSLLGQRALGAIPGVRKLFLSLMMGKLMRDVNASINGAEDKGANYYVIAYKI